MGSLPDCLLSLLSSTPHTLTYIGAGDVSRRLPVTYPPVWESGGVPESGWLECGSPRLLIVAFSPSPPLL